MEGLAKKKGGVDWQMLRNWMFEKGTNRPHLGLNEPCSDLHPNNSCAEEVGLKFIRVARSNNLLYMAIHFVPFLLFKAHNLRKKSKREILAALLKLMKRYVGSILFMSSFVAGFRAMFCVRGTLENTLLSTHVTTQSPGSCWDRLLAVLVCSSKRVPEGRKSPCTPS